MDESENKVAEELAKLSSDDWQRLSKQLQLYALWRVQQYGWQGHSAPWKRIEDCILPSGITLDDVVLMAIERALKGSRNWPPERVSFFGFLKGCVSSIINGITKYPENKVERRESTLTSESEEGLGEPYFETHPNSSPAPDAVLLMKENQEFITALWEYLNDDVPLQELLLCMEGGDRKPQDYAEVLKLPVEEINNMQKRLRRRINKFKEAWAAAREPKGGETK